MFKSGIYKIINESNGKVYIGQSVDVYNRLRSHKLELKAVKSIRERRNSSEAKIKTSVITKQIWSTPERRKKSKDLFDKKRLIIQEALDLALVDNDYSKIPAWDAMSKSVMCIVTGKTWSNSKWAALELKMNNHTLRGYINRAPHKTSIRYVEDNHGC